MSAYTDNPGWLSPDGDGYRVERHIWWELGRVTSGLWIEVPPGFRFDVSVPWFARWLFSPHDKRFLKAAALHDWLLADGWSSVEAAGVFHQAMKADGVPRWRRLVMFLAVVLFRFE